MELTLNKLELLLRAVEVTYFVCEVEYNKLALRQKIGEVLSDLDKERLNDLIDKSDEYSKLREELQICVDTYKTRLIG